MATWKRWHYLLRVPALKKKTLPLYFLYLAFIEVPVFLDSVVMAPVTAAGITVEEGGEQLPSPACRVSAILETHVS